MKRYKNGDASEEELGALLLRFGAEFYAIGIEAELNEFKVEGRSLLFSVHAQDVEAGAGVLFISTEQELSDWLLGLQTSKLILFTKEPFSLPPSLILSSPLCP